MPKVLAGAVPSPNIWGAPHTYELENLAIDPDRRIEAAMAAIRPWRDAVVLDVGCGTGFHLPRFAELAARVIGVEPHASLARQARRRAAALPNVSVHLGVAQELPLPDRCVDVVHARWAYFFGPGCEAGLDELARVVRRGGVAFVIDFDATASRYGGWFRRAWRSYDPARVERFWARHGFAREPLLVRWRFGRRDDLAAVLRIEFQPDLAEAFLAEHQGTELDCAINLWWRRY
ncbi:MAG: methyltransferase domain-containing protein [Streptosporangiales bacterium]|nr:methyltransferase domain-containing protein [Streptosporangiales bacterium]